MKFKTKVVLTGNNTGIGVSEEILEKLGGGKRPLVVVKVNDYTYRSAVGKMGDKYMISLSAENRKNAGVKGGDTVDVTIELDKEPRTIAIPEDFKMLLESNPTAKSNYDKLAPSKKKAMILSITDAKTDETRSRRIDKALESLK